MSVPTSLDAVVFDLDGTLIDSAPGLQQAAAALMAELSLPEPDLPTTIGFVGSGAPKLVERCLRWAGAEPEAYPQALDRFLALYNRDPMSGTTTYPGAQALLDVLHERGLHLGLCTNKPARPTRTILEALALGPFDAVVGGDSLPVRKPDPAPLLHVIAALGATADTTLYVGDTIVDWHTARAAGVAYAHIDGGYQTTEIPDFSPAIRVFSLTALAEALATG
ncbi:phosphoglycolate phosphatase [Jannaschia marina]|uniref:phosphoglycolate phosphatase n=1 Tax=Jannaschia marina TaxID=2741674 RepID=UPI0015C7DA8E|nr:phosphoglycolate phosphatase [Jannaschia marina]